jgi:hypothetical protein
VSGRSAVKRRVRGAPGLTSSGSSAMMCRPISRSCEGKQAFRYFWCFIRHHGALRFVALNFSMRIRLPRSFANSSV